MLAERWSRIEEVFRLAREKPPQERPGLLDALCQDDAELRREVERLLAAHEEAGSFLSSPVFAGSREPVEERGRIEPDSARTAHDGPEVLDEGVAPLRSGSQRETISAGARIGPYRIVGKIGDGGMGSVYAGERADGQFEKRVAIKLVKRGVDTDEVLDRFRNERQILASLQHPNIAQLHDGGVTDDGRPFLVMELVNGLPIDRFCDERRLSVPERLELFATVCDAVRYAHQNLIVHRDLKPSNILVFDDPHSGPGQARVKLLDFGIAKLLDYGIPSGTPMTRTGMQLMTPEYAAPEQVRGEAVTTGTDVYGLGIVLYELLTGRRPYDLASQTTLEAIQAVLEQTPQRPSSAATAPSPQSQEGPSSTARREAVSAARSTTPARLEKQLRGDLDTILLKALRKEPERRYSSVEALTEDIRRHLEGRPVSARPDAFGYRLVKFIRRHRVVVAASGIVLVSLLGGLSAALWQAGEARRERDVAQEVSRFLEELFNASDPFLAVDSERADELPVRVFLDRGAARIQSELDARPAVQARMLDVVSRVYRNLSVFDQAEPLAREALELRRSLSDADPRELANSLRTLAGILHDRGQYDSAEPLFREALAMHRAKPGGGDLELAGTLAALGALLRDKGAFEEAERLQLESLELQRATLGSKQLEVADTLLELGRLHQDQANLESAEPYYREALSLHRERLESDHPKLASSVENMGTFLKEKGDLDAAEPLLREALAMRREVLGEDHLHTVTSRYELAGLLREKQQYDEAVELFQLVLDQDRKLLGNEHHYVALVLNELGITSSRMGAYDDAERYYGESLSILRRALPDEHPHVSGLLIGLGYVYVKKNEPQRGEPLLREALRIRLATMGEDAWRTGVAKSTLGECLMLQGRYAEAEPLLVEGYATLREVEGPTRAALERLVAYYERVGRPEPASEYRTLLAGADR